MESASTSTVLQICSSVWLAVMKKRIRALLSGTAGYKMGCASMPSRSSAAPTRMHRAESPRMIGITGVPALAPVSSPRSTANLRKRRERSRRRVTRSGSSWTIRTASKAAAALAGEIAVAKTKAGVVYFRYWMRTSGPAR